MISDHIKIEVMHDTDWIEDDMSKRVFEVLAGNDKIPFEDSACLLAYHVTKSILGMSEVYRDALNARIKQANEMSVSELESEVCALLERRFGT